MAVTEETPYLFPNLLLAILPGGYAWQIYGWRMGLGVYFLTYLLLTVLGWVCFYRTWSYRQFVTARVILLVLAVVTIGISAMEICDYQSSACHRVLWPK